MKDNKEVTISIEGLYNQDVDERKEINWKDKNKVVKLKEKDKIRRQKAKNILDSDILSTGLDFHHASLIFQHGEITEDYKLAHELAEKAINLGDETAKWLYAATFDRWLLSSGKPQRYGTQFKQNENGEWELGLLIDSTITDEERARYNVPPLSEALRVYKERYNTE